MSMVSSVAIVEDESKLDALKSVIRDSFSKQSSEEIIISLRQDDEFLFKSFMLNSINFEKRSIEFIVEHIGLKYYRVSFI